MGDQYEDYDDYDDGFADYVETTVDPGPWLLVATTFFCFLVMLIGVPYMVLLKREKDRKSGSEEQNGSSPDGSYIQVQHDRRWRLPVSSSTQQLKDSNIEQEGGYYVTLNHSLNESDDSPRSQSHKQHTSIDEILKKEDESDEDLSGYFVTLTHSLDDSEWSGSAAKPANGKLDMTSIEDELNVEKDNGYYVTLTHSLEETTRSQSPGGRQTTKKTQHNDANVKLGKASPRRSQMPARDGTQQSKNKSEPKTKSKRVSHAPSHIGYHPSIKSKHYKSRRRPLYSMERQELERKPKKKVALKKVDTSGTPRPKKPLNETSHKDSTKSKVTSPTQKPWHAIEKGTSSDGTTDMSEARAQSPPNKQDNITNPFEQWFSLEPPAIPEEDDSSVDTADLVAQLLDKQTPKRERKDTEVTPASIISFDRETRKILSRAIPYTIDGLIDSITSNICMALVGRFVGTRALAAYALVMILCGLTDGVLGGPISAVTTLCAHAVGSGDCHLAGQYAQLASVIYLVCSIPVMWFWWTYMDEMVLFLDWGDKTTAALASDFTRVTISTYVISGVEECLWNLLEVGGHVKAGVFVSVTWSFVDVIVIAVLVTTGEQNATLYQVGLAYVATTLFFVAFTYVLADFRGWLRPFKKGLFQSFALTNGTLVKSLLKQAIPLAVFYLLDNVEWAVLTVFASYLGPAEVAAWAILGSIWGVFYSITSGIGDAAELRVAYHFGNNDPEMARLTGYKALFLSMSVASVVSIVFFSMQNRLPKWFTVDETLQDMLSELVPFVGVANLTMQFGMTSWSLIGAQGKYKLATWVSFISSWGITMPLAAMLTYGFRIDLQGLTSGVVIGYVTTGAVLSYVLLTTNWSKVAKKIQASNEAAAAGEDLPAETDYDELFEGDRELYAALQGNHSQAARQVARRNIRLVTIPAGSKTGIKLGNLGGTGVYVLQIRRWSPLRGEVNLGDSILAVNSRTLKDLDVAAVSKMLKSSRNEDRDLTIVSPPAGSFDESDDLFNISSFA